MTAIQDYQYGPLANDDNTRFIQLYPATHFQDPIRVDIIERAYDASKTHDSISYEALSYTWGSDTDSAYIFVGANSRLRVRRNVTNILRYLRGGVAPGCTVRTLWIDAVCINQEDNNEKGKQVTVMGEIYACATSVLIWTGEPGSDLQALQEHYTSKEATEWHDEKVILLMQFFETGWFTRRWVVQEIMHAREAHIICGNGTMDWQKFRSFVRILSHGVMNDALTPGVVAILRHLNNLAAVRNAEYQKPSLDNDGASATEGDDQALRSGSMITLLVRYSTTECADDRDRIYALRSLSSTPITVDYQITAAELYNHLSLNEVIRCPMAVLSCAGAFGASEFSWVPNWKLPMRYTPFSSSLNMQYSTPSVGKELVSLRDCSLTIKARFCGLVESVVDPDDNTLGPHQILHKWGHYFAEYNRKRMPELNSADGKTLFCTLSVTYIEPDMMGLSEPSPYRRELQTLSPKLLRHFDTTETNMRSTVMVLGAAHLMGLGHTKRGRSCFFTNGRQFGLGPDSIQIGDWIVSMLECDSMLVLRPLPVEQNIEQTYGDMGPSQHPAMTVVGDCWIPGLIKSNRQNTESHLRTFYIV